LITRIQTFNNKTIGIFIIVFCKAKDIMLEGIIGVIAGGGLGYLIGTQMSKLGGGCPILCNPKISTIYFAFLGLLFATGY
jgi:hypothetical protein